MNLEKHIGHNESIKLKFGISPIYLIIKLIIFGIFLGWLSYFYWGNPFFSYPPLIILGLVIFYELAIFFTTHYFVTELKIYKKNGILWKKIIDTKKEEITDISVIRSFLDKFLFFTGTLEINTAGSDKVEIILIKVNNPYSIKKEISQIWNS